LKPTRKNLLKKEKTARRQRWRERFAFSIRAVLMIGALMTTSAGFIFVYDYFTQSSHFLVSDITVTGMERLSRGQVLASGGIDPRTNILALNLTTARKRLLAAPWIAEATISREIPSGLHISVREEQPLAFMEMREGEGFLINNAGTVFKRETSAAAGGLPRVQGLTHRDLPVPGKQDTEAFRSVMTLLRLSREKSNPLPYAGLRRILMDREVGATVFTGEDQRTVKLGFGHYREKYAVLGQLMVHLKKDSRLTRIRVVDLFDVNRIVITLAPAGLPGLDQEEV
jgi:cell division protein FtsQ